MRNYNHLFNDCSTILVIKTLLIISLAYYSIRIVKWLYNYFYKVWIINKIPGLFMIPFIGNTDKFLQPHSGFLFGLLDCVVPFKDKKICRFWIGTQPYVSFHKADNLDILFDTSKHTKKSFDYSFLAPWLGDGLLLSYGDKWQVRRKLITPTFHFDILKDFFNIMNEQCDIMIEEIKKEVEKTSIIHLAPFIGCCALDIICETAMGQTVNAQKNRDSEYLRCLEKIGTIALKRARMPWLWSNWIFNLTEMGKAHNKGVKSLHKFTNTVIEQRLSDYQQNDLDNIKRIALLDLLLKAHQEDPTVMTLNDVREEVDTFMFEGHDTTSSAIEWTCYCLARHPDIQRKVHEELDELIGTSSRTLTMDDLNKLKYLELVIKEAMRIYPAVPVIFRELTEDDVIAGYKVLKGTSALIFIYQINRDERYFPEPEKFIPERFLPEKCENRPPYAYIPFSAGRRNCIGQRFALLEDKLLVANILRNFELDCEQNIKDLIPEVKLILRSENPIVFKIRNRLNSE